MGSSMHIDGSIGGGQILRSALSLSMLTQRPFRITDIRRQRAKPGLMRQHLAAVRAAAQICGAELRGAELGATELEFRPGALRPGSYRFAIGSAGSACLVLQTLLPALALANSPSELVFEGGTHNPLAPPYPYLDRVVFPLWERMGVGLERRLVRAGFYPAGGGEFQVRVAPVRSLAPLSLLARGPLRRLSAEAVLAQLPAQIAQRELAVLGQRLGIAPEHLHIRTHPALGPGNALCAIAEFEHITEMMVDFGERGLRAESLAGRVADSFAHYLGSHAVVGEHLADQLLLPLALAGGGAFSTLPLSEHATSNLEIVQRFVATRFECEQAERALIVRARGAAHAI